MADTDDEGFLGRWARRKQAEGSAAAPAQSESGEERLEAGAADAAGDDGGTPEAERPLTAEEVAALPNIDELDESSDYTQFLRDGVPDALRRLALRRLWRLNPIIAHRDGLNEYDEDFNDIKLVGDAVQTIYKAGRGYFSAEDKKTPVRPSEDNPLPAWEIPETAAVEDGDESELVAGAETADPGDEDGGDDRVTARVGEEAAVPLGSDAAGETPGDESGKPIPGEFVTEAAGLGDPAGARRESPSVETEAGVVPTKPRGESGAASRRRWGHFQG